MNLVLTVELIIPTNITEENLITPPGVDSFKMLESWNKFLPLLIIIELGVKLGSHILDSNWGNPVGVNNCVIGLVLKAWIVSVKPSSKPVLSIIGSHLVKLVQLFSP